MADDTAQTGELELWQPTLDELKARLTDPNGGASFGEVPAVDGSVIQAAIAARYLELDADAALAGDGLEPINAQTASKLGPLELTGGAILKSTKPGAGFYYLLEGRVLSDGSPVLISCGAHTVLAQLAKRMVAGPWPTPPLEFIERDEPTAAGGKPISIKLANPPA